MKKRSFISLLIYLIIFSLSTSATAAPAADTIVIDDLRNLQVTEETILTIDGRAKAREQFGTGFLSRTLPGYKARVNYNGDGNGNGGDLSEIHLLNSVVGPVTSNDSFGLGVLLENIPVHEDTVLVGIDDISELQLGDIVAVSGLEAPVGSDMRTTRIEYLADGADFWLITSNITGMSANGFYIRNQVIHTDSTTTVVCGAEELTEGLKVTVELTPTSDYVYGDDLHGEKVTCYADFDPDPPPPPSVFINGDITTINESQSQMVVDGYTINLNDATEIISRNGSTSLEVGMNVSVTGSEIPSSEGQIMAAYVYILETGGPEPVDLSGEVETVNESQTEFTVGDTTVMISPVTNFVDGTQADLVVGALVDVTGVEDTNTGSVIAEVVFFRTEVTQPPVFFSGFITNVGDDGSQITVDNQVVNISDDTQIVGGTIDDLLLDVEVYVAGVYASVANEVNATLIEIGGRNDPPGNNKTLETTFKASGGSISGSGTVTKVIEDVIFRAAF
ncbi:hypothetical protein MNBD_GAMMA01-1072 [hydrothermal vent metagenome]|uniref:DUF5666 domain-containing protein n=1 Tax=hydrothermal vent metagenome TaxID=652676 RepID=A0A3B0V6A1_9ZZZZ